MRLPATERFATRFHRDYYGGALMVVFGLGAVFMSVEYRIGSLRQMGPGFFPAAVGAVLAVLGVVIALGAAGQQEDGDGPRPEWRGWACIGLSLVAFIAAGRFGLMPASFATVFVAAMGDRDNTVASAALVAVAVSLVCLVVFWWALRLQFPLFGSGW